MNSLIQITKNTINDSEINSVNARDIYNFLEVKSRFNDWINNRLSDFEENLHFIVVTKNLVTEANEYYLDLDTAKHISMLERNAKGKEARQYFIDIEKSYYQQKPLAISEQIVLIAQGHQEVNERLDVIEYKIENDITLTSAQKFHLKELVTKKVFELKQNHNLDDSFTKKNYQRIWKKLKKHFIVSSYMEIPKSKFDGACNIVSNIWLSELL